LISSVSQMHSTVVLMLCCAFSAFKKIATQGIRGMFVEKYLQLSVVNVIVINSM